MNSSYKWLTLGTNNVGSPKIIDIMGAPIQNDSVFKDTITRILSSGTLEDQYLCISGELKELGDGQPASNFRFNLDKDLNETVVNNYIFLFNTWVSEKRGPIIVTTIPRNWRPYSWFIREDGMMFRKGVDFLGQRDTHCSDEDELMMGFLLKRGVSQESLIKIRESCKGAKYHSYLIDMISFLYQTKIDSDEFYEIFDPDYRVPISTNEVTSVGRWVPKAGYSHLYWEKTKSNDGIILFKPKKDSVKNIYQELMEAISPYANTTKNKIREYLSKHTIHRWTDFDANDTDDAFTILMLIHSLYPEDESGSLPISMESRKIRDHLEEIMKPWFDQL